MRRIRVDVAHPDPQALEEVARVIRASGIVAVPTDTLYGLAVNPFDAAAVARLFAVKERSTERALPLIASDVGQVIERIGPLPAQARRLASRFWPGPLTILIAAPAALVPAVTGGTGAVGVRVPAHEVARALCRTCGGPLTATSANISGTPAFIRPDEVERALGDRIDLLVDAGPTPGGAPSTIVDTTGPQLRLVREGAIPWVRVEAAGRNSF